MSSCWTWSRERERARELLGDAGAVGLQHVPLEARQRFLGSQRQDDVGLQIVGVEVEHQVGKDPVVEGFGRGALGEVAAVERVLVLRADGRVLLRVVRGRLDPIGAVVELLEELRVHDRDVVPLEVVVHVDLPVARDLVVVLLEEPHVLEGKGGGLFRNRAEHLLEGRRRGVEAYEQKRSPRLHARRGQILLRLLETAHAVPLGRGQELSIQAVGPAVIAAHERLAVARSARDGAGAVAADVGKRMQGAVVGARHDQGLVRHRAGEVVAGERDLLGVTDELPGLRENPVLFALEDGRIAVPGRGDGLRRREVRIEGEIDRHGYFSLRPPRAPADRLGARVAIALSSSSRNC